MLAAILPVGTFLITALVCRLAAALHPLAGLAVQMFWCAQALAAKGLAQESRNVYKELQKQDLPAARKAVARIVGRDTQNLTAEGVTKAAVETVAENASDGVIAPLLFMLLLWLLPLDTVLRTGQSIIACCPAGSLAAVLAKQTGTEATLASQAVAHSTVCMLVTVPAMLLLTGVMFPM